MGVEDDALLVDSAYRPDVVDEPAHPRSSASWAATTASIACWRSVRHVGVGERAVGDAEPQREREAAAPGAERVGS